MHQRAPEGAVEIPVARGGERGQRQGEDARILVVGERRELLCREPPAVGEHLDGEGTAPALRRRVERAQRARDEGVGTELQRRRERLGRGRIVRPEVVEHPLGAGERVAAREAAADHRHREDRHGVDGGRVHRERLQGGERGRPERGDGVHGGEQAPLERLAGAPLVAGERRPLDADHPHLLEALARPAADERLVGEGLRRREGEAGRGRGRLGRVLRRSRQGLASGLRVHLLGGPLSGLLGRCGELLEGRGLRQRDHRRLGLGLGHGRRAEARGERGALDRVEGRQVGGGLERRALRGSARGTRGKRSSAPTSSAQASRSVASAPGRPARATRIAASQSRLCATLMAVFRSARPSNASYIAATPRSSCRAAGERWRLGSASSSTARAAA